MESFITAASERSCQHIENETAANEGEIGGGDGVIKMLGGWGLIKMECPILFSAPAPHFLFRSAAAGTRRF